MFAEKLSRTIEEGARVHPLSWTACRVSLRLYEPAINLLWTILDDVQPLICLLPSEQFVLVDEAWKFTGKDVEVSISCLSD